MTVCKQISEAILAKMSARETACRIEKSQMRELQIQLGLQAVAKICKEISLAISTWQSLKLLAQVYNKNWKYSKNYNNRVSSSYFFLYF